ncbi:MAG: glutamate racemase [Anaeroplasma bactoclasticum]|nr:glutamate racemase [Anaeroplasma bactoclasticum]
MKEKIGIFDSGIGGLSVYEAIKSYFQEFDILYLADEVHLPYGVKSKSVVRSLALKHIKTLKQLGATWIVVACNTATASIIDICEKDPSVIGVIEPTAQWALQYSKNKKIALFATQLTVESKIYEKYLSQHLEVAINCSCLVPLIEQMHFSSKEMHTLIQNYLHQLKEADTLILGCTHFKWIRHIIAKICPNLLLVDSGEPIVDLLRKQGIKIQKEVSLQGKSIYYTTGDVEEARHQLEMMHFYFDQIQKIE